MFDFDWSLLGLAWLGFGLFSAAIAVRMQRSFKMVVFHFLFGFALVLISLYIEIFGDPGL